MQCDLAVRVLPGANSAPPFSRLIDSDWADEVGIRFQRVINLRLKAGEADYIPVEYDQCGFAIPPGQVAQKLVNRLDAIGEDNDLNKAVTWDLSISRSMAPSHALPSKGVVLSAPRFSRHSTSLT